MLTNNSDISAHVCVGSFASVITGKPIVDVVGTNQKVKCTLGGLGGTTGDCLIDDVCTNIGPGPGNSVSFSVLVPEKLIQIRDNSPYQIKLNADQGGSVTLGFGYRVPDIRP